MGREKEADSLGIKEARKVVRFSPKSFSQCRLFSYIQENKEYVSGKGIVHHIVETVVYFECLHVARPETLGGTCWKGTIVCKDCLVPCAESDCGRMVCKSRTCDCGAVKDGKLYCSRHAASGLLALLFG